MLFSFLFKHFTTNKKRKGKNHPMVREANRNLMRRNISLPLINFQGEALEGL